MPNDPVIQLFGIYPKKRKTLIWKYICTLTFSTELFTIDKIWKQSTNSSIDEWIKMNCKIGYKKQDPTICCLKKYVLNIKT